jgi:ATP-dependent protease ClpP protease subunit
VLDQMLPRAYARYRALANGRTGYRVRAQHEERAVVELYDAIGDFGVSPREFVADLRGITAPVIELHINSPGGLYYDGLVLYNALVDHPARVEAIVDGLAASAASFVLQAADHRTMNRHSELMIHDALMITFGNEADHLDSVAQLGRVSDQIAGIYTSRAGGSPAGWRAAMREETWYSAAEATDAGLADEHVPDADHADGPPSTTSARAGLATARAHAFLQRTAR